MIRVPAVAVSGVDNSEVLPFYVLKSQGIRGWVAIMGLEVKVNNDPLVLIAELEDIKPQATNMNSVFYLYRTVSRDAIIEQVFGVKNFAEGEFEFEADHFRRCFLLGSRLHELFFGGQSVVAPEDILHLGSYLTLRADENGFDPGIARVVGEKHALTVKHLENGILRHVGETAVLDQYIGEQNNIGSGLKGYAILLFGDDQSPFHEMLHTVRRTGAHYAEIRFRGFHPIKPFGNLYLGKFGHKKISGRREKCILKIVVFAVDTATEPDLPGRSCQSFDQLTSNSSKFIAFNQEAFALPGKNNVSET